MRRFLSIISFALAIVCAGVPSKQAVAQTATQLFWALNQTTTVVDPCAGVATATDPDAQKFLCATKISNQTIGNAINTLVISLKNNSLWNENIAIYPLVSDGVLKTRGEQTAYNLKDTNLFKITWQNTSFSANGIDFTSALGHGVTSIFPNTHLANPYSVALGYYSREQLTGGRDWADIQGSSVQLSASCELSAGTASAFMYNGSTAVSGSNGGSQGMFIFTRTAASGTGVIKIYKNGSQIASGNFTAGSVPTTALTLGYNSTSGQRECAFAFVSNGLTADQASTFSTIINTFNTSLSRNVFFILIMVPAGTFRRRRKNNQIKIAA